MSDMNVNYGFKDLATVEVDNSIDNNSNVIIEEGGLIKKAPAGMFGKVKTVNDVEPDENGNIEVEMIKVQTAEVGQTLVVKAIDENGKPTEWECVNAAGGSGFEGFLFYQVDENTDNYACTCTYQELAERFENNKPVFGVAIEYGAHTPIRCSYNTDSERPCIEFYAYDATWSLYEDNTMEMTGGN